MDYEQQREWLEGLAKYVELGIWRQAAATPGYVPAPALADDSDFGNYRGFDQAWSQEVMQITLAAQSQDTLFYYSGMAQAVLLDRLAPDRKGRILSEGMTLEDLLREALAARAR